MTLGLGIAGSRARVDTSVEGLLPEGDRDLHFYRGFVERLGSDELVAIGWESPRLFDRPALEGVQRIAESLRDVTLEQDPTLARPTYLIDRVLSLPEVPMVRGFQDEDGEWVVSVRRFLDRVPETRAERRALWERAFSEKMLVGTFVSHPTSDDPDAPLASLVFGRIVHRADDADYRGVIKRQVDEIVRRERASGSDAVHVYSAGIPLVKAALGETGQAELFRLVPVSWAVILAILFVVFRSLRGVVLPMLAIWIAAIWTLGLVVVYGARITVMSVVILTLIEVIGAATTIYLLSAYHQYAAVVREPRRLVRSTLDAVAAPAFFASFTTAAGFLSLQVSPIGVIREVGLFAAFGVIVVWAVAMTLLPATLTRMPPPPTPQGGAGRLLDAFFARLTDFCQRFRWPVFVTGLALMAVAVVGILRIQATTELLAMLRERHPVVVDQTSLERSFGGMARLDVSVRTAPGALLEPHVLRRIERFQSWLERQPEVSRTRSIVDVLKSINRVMSANAPGSWVLPASREQIANYLLVTDDPTANNVTPYLFPHWEAAEETRILVLIQRTGTREYADFVQRCNDRLAQELVSDPELLFDRGALYGGITGLGAIDSAIHGLRRILGLGPRTAAPPEHLRPGEIAARVTGAELLYANMANGVVEGQVNSLLLSFLVICATMMAMLRSVAVGCLGMIPNLFPIVLLLGVMGFGGVNLDIGTAMISAIAIGIAVDDTIHFLARYRVHRGELGEERDAVRATLEEVGRPILITSVVLALGLSVLTLSVFEPHFWFGIFCALAVLLALLADLVLLPAVLFIFKPRIARPGGGAARGSARAVVSVGLGLGLGLAWHVPDAAAEGKAAAAPVAPSGEQIMRRVEALPRGGDQRSRATWRLVDAGGRERVRETRVYWRRFGQEHELRSQLLVVFDTPADVKDASLLVWSPRDPREDSLQWIYLPAFRRVRRVAAGNRSSSFMGTEFSYEDLIERSVDADEHAWLRDESMDGRVHHVIESVPRTTDAVYTRRVQWIDAEHSTLRRIDFYRAARVEKTLELWHEHRGGVWIWRRLEMTNHRTSRRTAVEVQETEHDVGLADELFTQSALGLGVR